MVDADYETMGYGVAVVEHERDPPWWPNWRRLGAAVLARLLEDCGVKFLVERGEWVVDDSKYETIDVRAGAMDVMLSEKSAPVLEFWATVSGVQYNTFRLNAVKQFDIANRRSKFPELRRVLQSTRRRRRGVERDIECPSCKKSFRASSLLRRYCSDSCRAHGNRVNERERREARARSNRVNWTSGIRDTL